MSLARSLLREFRPLFRMLEEPFSHHQAWPVTGTSSRSILFDDPFFQNGARPAVDLTDDGKQYVVEAELPGVKKEDVEVRIDDSGRSVTIEGRIVRNQPTSAQSTEESSQPTSGDSGREHIRRCSRSITALTLCMIRRVQLEYCKAGSDIKPAVRGACLHW